MKITRVTRRLIARRFDRPCKVLYVYAATLLNEDHCAICKCRLPSGTVCYNALVSFSPADQHGWNGFVCLDHESCLLKKAVLNG